MAADTENDREQDEQPEEQEEERVGTVQSIDSFMTAEELHPQEWHLEEEEEQQDGNVGSLGDPNSTPEDMDPGSNENSSYFQGVIGIAGIVAYRLRKRFPQLSSGTAIASGVLPQWVEPYSKSGRSVPSDEFESAARQMDVIFRRMHNEKKSYVDTEAFVLKRFNQEVVKLSIQIPIEVVALFGRLRLLVRVRCINKNRRSLQAKKANEAAKNNSRPKKHTRGARTAKNFTA